MTTFQILGLALSISLTLATLHAALRRRMSLGASLAWLTLWLGAAVTIARPGLTVVVAQALGIDRGADLVFYSGILASLLGFYLVLAKFRKIEENLTTIVRHIALGTASNARDLESSSSEPGPDSPDPDR